MSLYYSDDHVTLYHGDCIGIDPDADHHSEWLAADVLVVDPPYGIAWAQRTGAYRGKGTYEKNHKAVANDTETGVRDAILQSWGDKPAIVFGSWKAPKPERVQSRLIWDKAGSHPGPLNSAFYTVDEEIYIIGTTFRKSAPPQRSVIRTTEQRSSAVRELGHPTPKPLGLMELLIDRCPQGLIADPSAGSGSTLVAAKNLGLKSIGVELEEKYCEIIAKRCQQEVLDIFGATA